MKRTQSILIRNLDMLMKMRGWTPGALAKASGVSPRMIAYILRGERVPSIETATQLGEAFGLDGWLLIHPSLPKDLKNSNRLKDLLYKWSQLSDEDLAFVESVIDRTIKPKTAPQASN